MFADLAVVAGDPVTPYRALIDATEEDIALTVVDGEPLYGRSELLQALRPGGFETVTATCGFEAGIDVIEPAVPGGTESFADIVSLLGAASALDFQHMKANFKDPAVAGMTDQQFQSYLDANFPLGLIPKSLDPYWVINDPGYFARLRDETNVRALNPAASIDIESFWDTDNDGIPNPCEAALLRSTQSQNLSLHLVNLTGSYIDDVPGSLSDGQTYFYLIDERGGPALTISLEPRPTEDTVRIHFTP